MNVPNLLSLIRLALVPVFAVVFFHPDPDAHYWAAGIYALAFATDVADGWIARHFNQITRLGRILDPLADKLLVIAAMAMFCQWGQWPAWALMVVLTREFAVTGLRLVAAGKGTVIAAGWSGKEKTASTMLGLCVLMAFPQVEALRWAVIAVVVVTTLYSGVEYFWKNWRCML